MTDEELKELLALPETLPGNATDDTLELPEEQRKFMEERKRIIGGTDAAALSGFSNYRTAWDVAAEKRGLLPAWGGSERTEIGRALEDPVARVYAARTGVTLAESPMLIDAEFPFMGGHPDRLIVDIPKGVEVKTVQFGFDKWSEPGEAVRVPKDYYVQCQHYLSITGFDAWDLVALFGLSRIRWYTIRRNERVIGALRSKEQEFWNRYVVGDEMPPMEASDRASEWMRLNHPAPKSETILFADEEQSQAIAAWRDAKTNRAAYEKEEEKWKIRIQQAIGDATGIASQGVTVSWKKNRDSVGEITDYSALIADLAARHGFTVTPADLAKFTKTVTTKTGARVMRLTGEK